MMWQLAAFDHCWHSGLAGPVASRRPRQVALGRCWPRGWVEQVLVLLQQPLAALVRYWPSGWVVHLQERLFHQYHRRLSHLYTGKEGARAEVISGLKKRMLKI